MEVVVNVGVYTYVGQRACEISVHSSQLCYKPKTALLSKVYLKIYNEKII